MCGSSEINCKIYNDMVIETQACVSAKPQTTERDVAEKCERPGMKQWGLSVYTSTQPKTTKYRVALYPARKPLCQMPRS